MKAYWMEWSRSVAEYLMKRFLLPPSGGKTRIILKFEPALPTHTNFFFFASSREVFHQKLDKIFKKQKETSNMHTQAVQPSLLLNLDRHSTDENGRVQVSDFLKIWTMLRRFKCNACFNNTFLVPVSKRLTVSKILKDVLGHKFHIP